MNDAPHKGASDGGALRLDRDARPGVQLTFAQEAERELARRSRPGAFVYFAVVVLLALSTSYYPDHPVFLCAIAALVLLSGGARAFAARAITRDPAAKDPRARWTLRGGMYATATVWGLFCAVTVHLYPNRSASTFLLLSTAALASGATSSLAPEMKLATRSLLLLVVPTVIAAALQGDRSQLAFSAATTIYLAFLLAQAREHGRSFRAMWAAAEQERLRNSEERHRIETERATLSVAIEQAAEEVLLTDAEGKIQYCNPAFERVTGYTRAEVVGRNPKFLKSGKQSEEFYRDLWAHILAGHVWTGRFTNRRKDGTFYEAEGTISPMHDANGRLIGFVSARHDVTERLHLEAQLRQAQKLESVGRLAGGVAHDFNNLLTVILGYSRVLLDEHSDPGDPLRQYVQEISAAGERAASLTRQLLSFSRKQILVPRPIELGSLVAEMQPMLQRLVGEDIRVEADPPEERLIVKADPDQMNQILMNLAANARDAMPLGGTLAIRLAVAAAGEVPAGAPAALARGPAVRLTVSDTGLGMDEETRQRLFEPFFTTKERGQGTGLGLATVYGIVQQSDGWIEVSSEPGKGAAFHVYLPRFQGEAAGVNPAADAPHSKGGMETILLVEDQDDLRRLVSRVLKAQGYHVLDASDGRTALRYAAETDGAIDLLLTDVIMPDVTGKEVADELVKSRPGIRVLFMSGYPGDVITQRGVQARGASYLAKPFTIDALNRKVREVLDTPD